MKRVFFAADFAAGSNRKKHDIHVCRLAFSYWKMRQKTRKKYSFHLTGTIVIAGNLPKLRQLNLTNCLVGKKGVDELKNLSKLETLVLDRESKRVDLHITDDIIKTFSFPNLTHLGLASSFITDQGLQHLHTLGKLSSINLGDCSCVSGKGLSDLFIALGNRLVAISLDNINLSEAVIQILAEQCPNLESLSLHGWILISDKTLTQLFMRCKQLSALNLGTSCFWEREAVWTHLQHPNRVIHSLIECCPQIHSLSISHCANISHETVKAIAKTYGANLRRLDLSYAYTIPGRGGYGLEDRDLKTIARHCPNLEFLNIEGCNLISHSTVAYLQKKCPNLHSLNPPATSNLR